MAEELSPKPEELLPEGELAAEQANQPGETEATIGGAATAEVAGEAATTEQHEAETGAAEQEPQHLGTVEHGEEGTSEDETPQEREVADQATHEGEEGRWDHDKAETLASVLQGTESFKENMDAHSKGRGDYIDKEGARLAELTGEGLEESKNSVRRQLVEEKRRYNERHRKKPENGGYWGNSLESKSDRVLEPYVELYDINPGKFAQMPTEEFMKIAEPLRHETSDVNSFQRYVNESGAVMHLSSAISVFV